MPTTRVMIVGLGPIGAGVARQLAARSNFKIVAAVDIDPAKAGRDLGELLGLPGRSGVKVSADARQAARKAKPQAAVLCTSSALQSLWPQIAALLPLRIPIVSTTEELAYPWFSNRALARKIDAAAKKAKVAVVGTGVNPGFAMDALPLTLTAISERVDRIRVDRIQDARIRRLPFQQKIGAGLTPEQFAEKVKALTVRHVGLTESVAMIADGLGWKLDRITDEIQPKIAQTPVESQFLKVPAGRVCGIVQDGVGVVAGEPRIVLHMEAYLGAPETYDSVEVEGSPRLHVKALGGYHGDVATASITVNTIPKVLVAAPGLHTMRSLALPSFAGGK
jgi:2,4-diaminopentanoate dehydrogenase